MRILHRLVRLLLKRQKWVDLSCIALGIALGITIVLTQISCMSVGPIKSRQEFLSMVEESIGIGAESIQDYGRATWYPGADAYGFFTVDKFESGVIVLLDCRLMFLTWNKKLDRYKIQYEFEYKKITDVRRRVSGVSQRIVIEGNSGLTNAFELCSNNGIGNSVARINRAIAFLRTKIPSSDAEENTYEGPSCQ